MVLHHFYMDGFVWKGKRNPALPIDLGITQRKTQAKA
jgi:hypothetical protein